MGLKLSLRWIRSRGLLSLRLKLDSDLGVVLGLCLCLNLLDLTEGLDLNLGTDLTLGLGLDLRLWGSHCGDDRGDR